MKKKFTGILLCLLMTFAFVLSGCDLFPRNMSAYLNKSVCTITYENGETEDITTREYINAFNSYGYTLVQNGTSYEDAANQTIDVLVNRHVLLNHATTNNLVTIDDSAGKEILDDVYTSLESNLETYIDEVRTDWDITAPTSPEESEDAVVYTPYVQQAEVVFDGENYKIRLLDTGDDPQTTNFQNIDAVITEFNNYALEDDGTDSARIRKEAYRRFISALKSNEEGLNLSTDNASVLRRYVEDVYDTTKENYIITQLEEYYQTADGYSTISVRQVLDKYKSLMLQSKFSYEANSENYDTAMLESFEDVYYVVDDNYFFVSNLLVMFDDEIVGSDGLTQKGRYDNLETEYNNGYITYGEYQRRAKELAYQVVATKRDSEGNLIEGSEIGVGTLLTNLQNALNLESTNEGKAKVFNEYLYAYGEDTGVVNAEYPYVIGTETSQMVESFTDAARKLNEDGVFGALSGIVPSEYGAHIIIYLGKVENLFTISDVSTFNLIESDIEKLTETKLSPLNNKTLFDKIFEQLSEDNYSIFENMNLNVLKNKCKIVRHESVYMNL